MILVLQRSQRLPLHHWLLSHTVHQVLDFHWEGAFPISQSFSAALSWFGNWLTLAKVNYWEIWCHSHAWNNKHYGRRNLGQWTVIQQCRLGQISLHTFCPSRFHSTSSRVRTLSQCWWSSKLDAWWMPLISLALERQGNLSRQLEEIYRQCSHVTRNDVFISLKKGTFNSLLQRWDEAVS